MLGGRSGRALHPLVFPLMGGAILLWCGLLHHHPRGCRHYRHRCGDRYCRRGYRRGRWQRPGVRPPPARGRTLCPVVLDHPPTPASHHIIYETIPEFVLQRTRWSCGCRGGGRQPGETRSRRPRRLQWITDSNSAGQLLLEQQQPLLLELVPPLFFFLPIVFEQ